MRTKKREPRAKVSPRTQVMEDHGVDRAAFPFASYVSGRGWKGHMTARDAYLVARSDAIGVHGLNANRVLVLVADTATGAEVPAPAGL